MSEPNPHEPLEPAPVVEGDLDAILSAAESLTEEVAREIGTTRPAGDAARAMQPGPVDSDAEVDIGETQILSLDELLAEAAAPPTPPTTANTADGGAVEARGTQSANAAVSNIAEPVTQSTPRASAAAAPASRAGKVEVRSAGDGVEARPEAAEASPAKSNQAAGESAAGQKSAPRERWTKRIRAGARRGVSATFATCAFGISIPISAALVTIRAIDRPFAGLSGTTKTRLGLIGMVSLVMGVLAFVLPSLMRHNPYAHLD